MPLYISNIVHGRNNARRRVTYLVDPDGHGSRRCAPESVVLTRWRQRTPRGRVYGGSRLSPTVWRAIPVALGLDAGRWRDMSAGEIEARVRAAGPALRTAGRDGGPVRVPSTSTLVALIEHLGAERLHMLISRHAEETRWESPGVPDLFLYARGKDGRLHVAWFVEVKKPGEPMTPGQPGEIAFLKSLGLRARVLRLIERPVVSTGPRKDGIVRARGSAREPNSRCASTPVGEAANLSVNHS